MSPNIEHEAFSSETIVLVGGNDIDHQLFDNLIKEGSLTSAEAWLKNQKWFGTAGDMEHLFRFWQLNFDCQPDFRPNYIVPNLNSIVRCLTGGKGIAVVPDFLCHKEIANKQIKLIWEGKNKLTNTLYFGCRKKTTYNKEIDLIKGLFKKVMAS